ncbi:hypothetical protein BDP27DRAFT_710968 [Rhodocollybia butyracea]|uniref:Uncharacterized protein n=1 Tax=Rhodocollybia butyracea TaxID=206335 RepID=A0A9P5Q2M9_9AGAR|nr:hypothetical protein BDP27DRAFT_710968 [Rhodocollybia butyracea]
MASATSPAGSMPENLEPDRSRVMSMLSGFANACLHEMAPHPAIAKELEVTKAENAALTRENKLLKADVKKLWQDNETLNSSLKQTAAERDHFKATTENLQAILSQSKEPLQALCLQLQQENDWVKRQHDVLRATTERLVNDGLQLGVLVNTNTTNNGKSQKIIGFRYLSTLYL